jgi:Ca2+-binding EF-hand superfamily protein
VRYAFQTSLLLAVALGVLPWVTAADTKKTEAKPKAAVPAPASAPVSDVQDFVFLSDTKPVLIRLHVQVDSQPYPAAWDNFMKKFFDYFDLDGDGFLNQTEVERVPRAQMLRFFAQGAIGFGRQGNTVKLADMDTNKDGKVSREEFADYYRKSGFGPMQLGLGPDRGTSDKLTDALFQYLDRDKDGKLSKEELAAASEVLNQLDLDEDEMISASELAPGFNGFQNFARQANQSTTAQIDATGVLLVMPGEPMTRLTTQILKRYDKDKNNKLSRTEIGWEVATFDRFDANKDGQLDAAELSKWLAGPPDLEMTVRLGSLVRKEAKAGLFGEIASQLGKSVVPAIEVMNPGGKPSPLAKAVRKGPSGSMIVGLGDAEIDLNRNDSQRFGSNRQFYLQQFKMAIGKKMYLEKAEAMKSPYFNGLFDIADRDRDGKLYEKELIAFLDLQDQARECHVALTITDYGRGLFELLDANGDGRLGPRELRTGWTRLTKYDRDGKGLVAKTDIPRRFHIMLSQGNTYFFSRFGNQFNQQRGQGMFALKSGPLWFRKMDRNGDGDVSRREFLGTDEDFKRIDTDGDGLIDAKEAEKADAWFRKRLEQNGSK